MILALAASAMTFGMTGCSVFSDILAWTSVAGTALDAIVSLLGIAVPPQALVIIQAIKAFLTDLANAVTEYQNDTNPADKATLLTKIRTLLADIAANLQSFFSQIGAVGPIISLALGLAQIILSAIAGFMGQLPPAPPIVQSRLTMPTSLNGGGRTLTITPKYYKSVGEFKRDFNSVAAAGGHPEAGIK